MKDLYICDDTRFGETASFCAANGFGIEVQSFYDPSYLEAEPDAISRHREAIAPVQKRSLHGPFGDLCAGSFDVMVRQVTRYRYEGAVRIAAELDIKRIILHHGYVPGCSQREGWMRRYPLFWREFLEDKPEDIAFHLENHLERDPTWLSQAIELIGDSRVSVCLDIGHVSCFAKSDPVEWIRRLGENIGYVHLHDNHGERDEHLALGSGTVAMEDVCSALNDFAPHAIWALEANGGDDAKVSVDWLSDHHFI